MRPSRQFPLASHTVKTVHQLIRAAKGLIFPPCCLHCRGEIPDSEEILCGPCWQEFQDNLQGAACPVCGHSIGPYALINGRCFRCQHHRPSVSRVARVGDYKGLLRDMILAFKFHRQSHLDAFFGKLQAAAIIGDSEIRNADLLVPIPLHWRRLISRTYNQADLLTLCCAHELKNQGIHIPIDRNLARIRHTPPQTFQTPTQRLTNLTGAFAVRKNAQYQGKHICLIDDVTTTGTTLRVAANTLKKAGAAKITAAVLATAAND